MRCRIRAALSSTLPSLTQEHALHFQSTTPSIRKWLTLWKTTLTLFGALEKSILCGFILSEVPLMLHCLCWKDFRAFGALGKLQNDSQRRCTMGWINFSQGVWESANLGDFNFTLFSHLAFQEDSSVYFSICLFGHCSGFYKQTKQISYSSFKSVKLKMSISCQQHQRLTWFHLSNSLKFKVINLLIIVIPVKTTDFKNVPKVSSFHIPWPNNYLITFYIYLI